MPTMPKYISKIQKSKPSTLKTLHHLLLPMTRGGGAVLLRGLHASAHMLGHQGTQQPQTGGQLPCDEAPSAGWHKLVVSLEKIGCDLVEEEEKTCRVEMHHAFVTTICALKEHGAPPEPNWDMIRK